MSILLNLLSCKTPGIAFKSELKNSFENYNIDPKTVSAQDLDHLPTLVKNYITKSGIVGKPRISNFYIEFSGSFSMSDEKQFQIKSRQYNFIFPCSRHFLMKGSIFSGRHIYQNGHAHMLVKLLGFIKVVDAKGPHFDVSDMITFFNDVCIFAPGALPYLHIEWEELDDRKVKAIFHDSGLSASAELIFNEDNELINFITYDRYYDNGKGVSKKLGWSTPVWDYKKLNGMNYPHAGEAIWHKENGDFSYIKINVASLEYNVPKLK